MAEISRLAMVPALCAMLACGATVAKQQPASLPVRALEPDIVDIRGIWRDTRLNRDDAIAHGLDPDRIQLPRKIRDQRPVYPPDARQTGTSEVRYARLHHRRIWHAAGLSDRQWANAAEGSCE
jgi:hypothetical protein